MLVACGLTAIEVVRRPRVAVLSTGDELVQPGELLRPGGVYDSNGAIIAAAVVESGGQAVPFGAVADDPSALERAMRDALSSCDIVVLSGGTSKGAGDLSHQVVSRLGSPGLVHGVALKPGKPLCLAMIGKTPLIRAARLSNLGDLHVPRFRRASDPRLGGITGRSRPHGQGPRADAHTF
jgi:molybdopterin molybdotransferase/putative molybdopterin biosynthesis protein